MAKKEKTFNYKLYALVAFLLVAAILACTTVFAVKQKYIAFDSEKLAVSYADTIIQKGDGYNAYTYTLSAKGDKYGDFIRKNYMYPIIYPGYSKDMDSKEFKELKKSGLDTDSHKSETTLNDDGTLSGVLAEHMYPYYIELIKTYGWDDYEAIYTNYFNKLVEERKAIFNDDYMSDEVMFTAFESNVATFGNAVTGTKLTLGADNKTVIQEESTGLYQTEFGKDYKITTKATGEKDIDDLDAYKAAMDSAKLETYNVSASDISAAKTVSVEATLEDGTVVAAIDVNLVKIGHTWYVDNNSTNTAPAYEYMAGITA